MVLETVCNIIETIVLKEMEARGTLGAERVIECFAALVEDKRKKSK